MTFTIEDWQVRATVDNDGELTLSAKHGIDPATNKSNRIDDVGADLSSESEFIIRLTFDSTARG